MDEVTCVLTNNIRRLEVYQMLQLVRQHCVCASLNFLAGIIRYTTLETDNLCWTRIMIRWVWCTCGALLHLQGFRVWSEFLTLNIEKHSG